MSQRWRIEVPPHIPENPRLDRWVQSVHAVLNKFPNFSLSSTTNGPESNTSGDPGEILVDVGSSATAGWIKQTGSGMTGWVELDNFTSVHDSFDPEYGMLYSDNTTIDVYLTTAATHDIYESGMGKGITASGVSLTVPSKGTYRIDFSATAHGASEAANFYGLLYRNTQYVDARFNSMLSVNKNDCVAMTGVFVSADTDDAFVIRFAGSNDTVTIVDAQFSIQRLE
jgi:hypothetical protein